MRKLQPSHQAMTVVMPWLFDFIVFPVLEELVFRAGVQHSIDEKWINMRGARSNLITSVLFSLAHVPAWGGVHAIMVFLPSLVFGFIYLRTGSLVQCIFAHSISNIIGSVLNVPNFLPDLLGRYLDIGMQ